MLPILTKYLLVHKKVVIPHIGAIELIQHSPRLDVADKRIAPFYFTAEVSGAESIPDHQLAFLKASTFAESDLENFGRNLQQLVATAPFAWKGIGVLKRTEKGGYSIESHEATTEGWQEVPAHKVMRANAEHQHLVGDRQLSSQQVSDILQKPQRKRSVEIIIAWVLLFLLVLFIVFQLYREKFLPSATGLKTRATIERVVPNAN